MTTREPDVQLPPGGGCPHCDNLGCPHCQDKPPTLLKALGPVTAELERMYIAHEEQAISNSEGLHVEAVLEVARTAIDAHKAQEAERMGYERSSYLEGDTCTHCREPSSTHLCPLAGHEAERRPPGA